MAAVHTSESAPPFPRSLLPSDRSLVQSVAQFWPSVVCVQLLLTRPKMQMIGLRMPALTIQRISRSAPRSKIYVPFWFHHMLSCMACIGREADIAFDACRRSLSRMGRYPSRRFYISSRATLVQNVFNHEYRNLNVKNYTLPLLHSKRSGRKEPTKPSKASLL